MSRYINLGVIKTLDSRWLLGVLFTYIIQAAITFLYGFITNWSFGVLILVSFIVIQIIFNVLIFRKYLYYRRIVNFVKDIRNPFFVALKYCVKTDKLNKKYYNQFKVTNININYTISDYVIELNRRPKFSTHINYKIKCKNTSNNTLSKIYYRFVTKYDNTWQKSAYIKTVNDECLNPEVCKNAYGDISKDVKIYEIITNGIIKPYTDFTYELNLHKEKAFIETMGNCYLIDISNFSKSATLKDSIELTIKLNYLKRIKQNYKILMYRYRKDNPREEHECIKFDLDKYPPTADSDILQSDLIVKTCSNDLFIIYFKYDSDCQKNI